MEFQFTLPYSNTLLPTIHYDNASLFLTYDLYPNVHTLTSSQYLQVPAGNYSIELDPFYEVELSVLQHGLLLATTLYDTNATLLEFTCNIVLPSNSQAWKTAPATDSTLRRFMQSTFNASQWDTYRGGDQVRTDGQVWLLRQRVTLKTVPSAMGLYFELQEGMTMYINSKQVFCHNVDGCITSVKDVASHHQDGKQRGKAILGAGVFREGTNWIAVACTSSGSYSSVVLSLFSLAKTFWSIATENAIYSSVNTGNVVRLL